MLISNKKLITLLSISVIITAVLSCDNPKKSSSNANSAPDPVPSQGLPEVVIPKAKPPVSLVARYVSTSPYHVTISQGIEEIKAKEHNNKKYTRVTIPNSVKTIGSDSFSYNKLISVIIPNSVEKIEARAFDTNELISVTISNSVKTIGRESFSHNRLISVTIPNSVEEIGIFAFAENPGLTKVIISKRLYDKYSAEELGLRFGINNKEMKAVVINEKVRYYLLTNPTKEHEPKTKPIKEDL